MNRLLVRRFFQARRLFVPWLILKRYPFRLVTAITGIAFAGILVLMQLSLQEALLRSSSMLIEKLDADLVMLSPSTTSLISLRPFPVDRIGLAYADTRVIDAYPLTKATIPWREPNSKQLRFVLGVGIVPGKSVFTDREIHQQLHELSNAGRILLDRYSRPEFGVAVAESALRDGRQAVFISNNQRLHVAGLFALGSSFAYESTVIASIDTLNQVMPGSGDEAALGVIKVREGSDKRKIVEALARSMPDDVIVMTKHELMLLEQSFWNNDKPIGFIFMFGSIMGLAVGCIMVYQTLSTDIANHLQSYAVMMCYGYRRTQLEQIVLMQGLLLTVLAFPIAITASSLLCVAIVQATRLPIAVSWLAAGATWVLMNLVSATAALFAMARLRDADPCELFT